MAAGLSQEQKNYYAKQALKSIQAQRGGVYRRAQAGCLATLKLDNGVELYVKFSNASNGETLGVLVAYNPVRNTKVEGLYGETASDLLARLEAVQPA